MTTYKLKWLTMTTMRTRVEANGIGFRLNLHPQPRVMSPISIFVCSICVDHVLFLNKTATMRLCRRAWGRVSHAAPLSLLAW